MNAAEARLWEIVEEAALAVTEEETGRLRTTDLVSELRGRLADEDLAEHVRAATVDKLAKSLARGFGEKRSPKPGRPSGMFHPRGILKLGSGLWVWMDYATDRDLVAWGLLSTKNLVRVAVAEAGRQGYVAERLEAFSDHQGWLLGRIEREVFGYAGADGAPDYSSTADEDEFDDVDE